jgi:uncharacterized protein GlcG (DUF336 family)
MPTVVHSSLALPQALHLIKRVLETLETQSGDGAIAIAIVDSRGEIVAVAAQDNAHLETCDLPALTIDVAYTAARAGQPSELAGSAELQPGTDNRRIFPHPGGVPLLNGERLVGAIAIGGRTSERNRSIAEHAARLYASF